MPKKRIYVKNPPVWVSQNFLTSSETIERIIRRTTISKDDHVVEIGPGKGHITRVLVRCCRRVTAIEIDKRLYDRLAKEFEGYRNVRLHHHDFLKWNLPDRGDYKVFSNIPFSCTTSILRKLTESKNVPSEAWLVMEKGAVKRFLGQPAESLRSLLLKPFFDMDIVWYFSRDDFHPKPSVDVVLFHLKKKSLPDIPENQQKAYERFVTAGLKYGLRHLFTKKQLSRALHSAGINCDATLSEIRYIQWLCLFRCYREYVLRAEC